MMVTRRGGLVGLMGMLAWQWKGVLLFTSGGLLAVAAHEYLGWYWLRLPALPLTVVGAALGIFVSFRTNSAYDRWWEGRKLWGRMINTSRMFATQVIAYLPRDENGAPNGNCQHLVRRHLAYVNALRILLREQDPWTDKHMLGYMQSDEAARLKNSTNLTHALLHTQLEHLVQLNDKAVLNDFRLQKLDESIKHLLDIQGGCERIKKTPLPRGYGFIAQQLIIAYGVLFPLGIVDGMGWATVPVNLLVCLSLAMISEVGRVLEDPFTMFYNGLPLTQICRTLEANLLERLGEQDLPAIPKPDKRGILM